MHFKTSDIICAAYAIYNVVRMSHEMPIMLCYLLPLEGYISSISGISLNVRKSSCKA